MQHKELRINVEKAIGTVNALASDNQAYISCSCKHSADSTCFTLEVDIMRTCRYGYYKCIEHGATDYMISGMKLTFAGPLPYPSVESESML